MGVVIGFNRLTVGVLNGPGAGSGFGTTHARIGYVNYADTATITPSSEDTDFPADSLKNPLTYEKWRPTSMNANLTFDFGTNRAIDYIGIAAHTLGTDGVSITAEYSLDNVSYTSLNVATAVSDDRAIMLLFDEVQARYVRIRFLGTTNPEVGVVYIGEALEMIRPFYSGHTIGVMARQTTVKPNKSVNGQWLGRSIVREGTETSYNWRHIPITWYETNVDPFAVHARSLPFFIAWNPQDFPDHVQYAWTSDTIAPTNMGVRDLIEFGFTAEGVE